MTFSAGPLIVQTGLLTCFGPVNTLVNNPGCNSGYRLAPGAVLKMQDGQDCAKHWALHFASSSKAVLAGFMLSTMLAVSSLGVMK